VRDKHTHTHTHFLKSQTTMGRIPLEPARQTKGQGKRNWWGQRNC